MIAVTTGHGNQDITMLKDGHDAHHTLVSTTWKRADVRLQMPTLSLKALVWQESNNNGRADNPGESMDEGTANGFQVYRMSLTHIV